MLTRNTLSVFAYAAAALAVNTATAQNYPVRPIRMVTSEAGGSADFVSRLIAQGLTNSLGQQVVVDNRGSASGIAAAVAVASAPPDGYTLLCYSSSIWISPLTQQRPYDPIRDFAPITLAVSSPSVVVVHPTVAAQSIKELIDLAKAKPGELNFGSAGSGSPTYIAVELFKSMTGVNMVSITYKGGGPALTALVAGEVQFMFATAGGVATHVKSGRLRALAVTSKQSSALFPSLPPVAATVPGYESITAYGVLVPARTPAALITRLNREIVRVLNQPEIKEKFLSAGVEVVGSSPEEFAAAMKSEIARMAKLIKEAGIKPE